jgi:hypothetical protein
MTTDSRLPSFVTVLRQAIDDHVAQREDRRGFSSLDRVLGEIRAAGIEARSALETALLQVVSELKDGDERAWEAVGMIVDVGQVKSRDLAREIEKLLDADNGLRPPAARFQAFLVYSAVGGILKRPRLDKETAMRQRLTPQWLDLVMKAYDGMPEAIVKLLEEELSKALSTFSWQDIRRRLPTLLNMLGSQHFNSGIQRIILAIPNIDDPRRPSIDTIDSMCSNG